jgi:hypothetical protein
MVLPRPLRRSTSRFSVVVLAILVLPLMSSVAPAQMHTPYDPPDIGCGIEACNSITLTVCGGGWGGNPAGFVVQWQTRADFDQYGWPAGKGNESAAPSFGWASFVGGRYALGMRECIQIQFGQNPFVEEGVTSGGNTSPLEKGTNYVFRTYGYGDSMMSESGWSGTLNCHTEFGCMPYDPPDIGCAIEACNSITLNVCGGGWGGAPGGFMIQWQKRSDLDLYGWPADTGIVSSSPSFAWASFTGGQYALGQYQCIPINFGENPFDDEGVVAGGATGPLTSGTDYVFRSYAYGDSTMSESVWLGTLGCHTDYDCPPSPDRVNCTLPMAWWMAGSPTNPDGNPCVWTVQELGLGNTVYSDLELESILRAPKSKNGLVQLAQAVTIARMNIAKGADGSAVSDALFAANRMIGDQTVPPVGDGYIPYDEVESLVLELEQFNNGVTGPGACQ